MITRRCTQRQFIMRPDRATNNAFIYCLAEAATRHRIRILFTVAMSNHHHTGIYDPEGKYPAFIEHFHKLFAKCMNSLRGRWENFWSSEQTSVVRLVDPDDVLEKMVYALANPVADHLVKTVDEWPGVNAFHTIVRAGSMRAHRPPHFFRADGPMPSSVILTFARPPGWEHLSSAEFADLLTERVRGREEMAARAREASGRRVFGRSCVLAQRWHDRPRDAEPRRDLDPRVAARNKWSRIEALLRNREFRAAYIQARDAFLRGVRDVVFPPGTWWMRVFAGASSSSLPAPA
jgi:hypothetical protein